MIADAIDDQRSVRPASVRTEIILRTATELFAQQGYHAVGMRLIAARVGVRGPSLYHHFASKEDILYAIALTVTKDYMDEHLPLLDADGSPAQRLAALIRAHLSYMWEHRLEEVVGLREMHALSPPRRAEINDYRRYYQRRIRDTIAAGVRTGDFWAEEPRLSAFVVLDMLNGLNGWFRPGGSYTVEEVIDRYVALIIDQLLHPRRPSAEAT